MVEYKKKWNKYKIGDVKWIDSNRGHFCRKHFIDYVLSDNDIKSILEVGGGELIEAQDLIKSREDLSYSVVDISSVFLDHCKTIDGIEGYYGDMTELPFKDNSFDLIYGSSILEHSPDIKKTLSGFSRVSNRFYFNMFKWNMKTGGLKSTFNKKKSYFSTNFNINDLIAFIEEIGEISNLFISHKDDENTESFDEYKGNFDEDYHRNGNYLSIVGKWK